MRYSAQGLIRESNSWMYVLPYESWDEAVHIPLHRINPGDTRGFGNDLWIEPNQSESALASGTHTIHLKWIPDPGAGLANDPPPDRVRLKVRSKVSAGGMGLSALSAAVDNGLGSNQGRRSIYSGGGTFADSVAAFGYGDGGEIHDSTRLYRIDNNAREDEITLSIQVTASSSGVAAGDPDINCYFVDAGANISATFDNRELLITRMGARHERFATASGVDVTYGDTVFSHVYDHRILSLPGGNHGTHSNKLDFDSNYRGGWSLNYFWEPLTAPWHTIWNWVGGEPMTPYIYIQDSKTHARRIAPVGGLQDKRFSFSATPQWSGQPIQTQHALLKYFARDKGDNAESEAHYRLSIHEPIELEGGPRVIAQGVADVPLITHANGVRQFLHSYTNPDNETKSAGDDLTMVHTETFVRAIGIGGEIGLGIGASLGLTEMLGLEIGPNVSINGTMNWEHSVSVSWEHNIQWPEIPPGHTAILCANVVLSWRQQDWRHYDQGGELLADPNDPSKPWKFIWYQRDNAIPRPVFKLFINQDVPSDSDVVETRPVPVSGSAGSA